MKTPEQLEQIAQALAAQLSDNGKLLEGGWRAYEVIHLIGKASPEEREKCRLAFYTGAQHIFMSLLGILDPGVEPTDRDLERMNRLFEEIQQFEKSIASI